MSTTLPGRRVLVVEDDDDIANAVADRLRVEGFVVEVASDGLDGLAKARTWKPDLIVLDLMLPGLSGHEVCRTVQAEMGTPILMLTALSDETDVLVGLRIGADDYMAKPFSPRELAARVEAILRRVEPGSNSTSLGERPAMNFGALCIDGPARRVTVAERDVHLTATEFNLIVALARVAGNVLSRADLLHQAWGYNDDVGSRTVDSHVRSVRRKIGDDWIRTVHGVGYSFEAPTQETQETQR